MTNLERSLLDTLTAPATPIDLDELERRGVLKASREARWYFVLKPDLLPAAVMPCVTAVERTRLGGRLVLMLRFRPSTTRGLKPVDRQPESVG